jgi:hypothetical protein
MFVKRRRVRNAKLLSACLVVGGFLTFSASAQQVPVEQQILQISSASQMQSIFNSSSPADQVTIIGLLPGVINRFKVNPVTALPSWLKTVMTQGLSSTDANVAKTTISQVGNLQMVSLAGNLISMYSKTNDSDIRVRVVRALGDMASSSGLSLLKTIIDSYVVCPETDEAIMSARKMCATSLTTDISGYCSNLNSQIQSGVFNSPSTKPLTSPDVSLMVAKGALQAIANGACGQ